MELNKLIQTVKAYRDAEVDSLLDTAFKIASIAHEGFQRKGGEPFIKHPLAVAGILADWYAPPAVVAVGLLHYAVQIEVDHAQRLCCLFGVVHTPIDVVVDRLPEKAELSIRVNKEILKLMVPECCNGQLREAGHRSDGVPAAKRKALRRKLLVDKSSDEISQFQNIG